MHLNLVRDKDTGKSRGFAFLKYEDQRSTDLAVDNLGGATVMGRMLRVDHVRYKRREEEGTEDNIAALDNEVEDTGGHARKSRGERDERRRSRKRSSDSDGDTETEGAERTRRPKRPQLKEEVELNRLIEEHDDEDPMKQYLIQEKREEVQAALVAVEKPKSRRRDRSPESRDRHRHRHHHRRRHSRERSRSRERRSAYRGKSRSPSRSPSREKRHHRSRRDRSR